MNRPYVYIKDENLKTIYGEYIDKGKDGLEEMINYLKTKEGNKDNVITELLKRIAILEYEVERQDNIIEEVEDYIEKMSYCSIVDNPKKDLQKILKKENKND